MIPKIIHYCWFGKNPLPSLAEKCIESWQKFCPDYQIVRWDEDNFDINQNDYVREAYEAKKYAFVTDYVRLYALHATGGIYMDTDVELLRPIDEFLSCEAFAGFELRNKIGTAIIGAMPSHPTVEKMMAIYNSKHFRLDEGGLDITTNVEILTDMLIPLGLKGNGKAQTVAGINLYPSRVFYPTIKRINNAKYMQDAYAAHYCCGSWKSARALKREKSIIFRIVRLPLSFISKLFTLIFGKRWTRFKNKIRDRLFKE